MSGTTVISRPLQVWSKHDNTYKHIAWPRLEIVPLKNPYRLKAGDKLPVRQVSVILGETWQLFRSSSTCRANGERATRDRWPALSHMQDARLRDLMAGVT